MDISTWSAQQLAEFLAAVSAYGDEHSAMRGAVELAAEAFEAEVGAVLRNESVLAAVGFPVGRVPRTELLQAARHGGSLEVPGAGHCRVLRVPLEMVDGDGTLVLARSGPGFSREEMSLLRAMTRVLSLALGNLRTMASLRERQNLLEKLSKIQRSISLRAPLAEVFDAITDGAAELLGEDIVTLYLVDQDDPGALTAASMHGMPAVATLETARLRVGHGVSGRSVAENRLVVVEDYDGDPHADRRAVRAGVKATMAAPVHDGGDVIGCLVVGSLHAGRTYSPAERDLLLAFAEHASLAVTDAKTVEALHEAVGAATHRAMHDPLTGLANRTRFLDRLGHALAVRRLPGATVAALYVDIDDFKLVNDRFGHGVGDLLLVEAAGRLNAAVRVGDTVARLGGDEFAVLLENASGIADAIGAAQRILEAFREPFAFGDVEIVCNSSVGIALQERGSVSADELLRNADVAMYRAKNSGKGCAVVFESAMYEALLDRLELESDLRRVVQDDEIDVFFQPIVRLRDNRILGVEALARWPHPTRGFVPPTTFIPLAEDTGLIVTLGRQVLLRSCLWVGERRRTHPEDELFVSVNLSAPQLQDPGLIAAVERALDAGGIESDGLVLEITESVFMQDTDVTMARLRALDALGVRLALDDFGTGYSSLSYLRRFPVDVLKIDRSFVSALRSGDDHERLTEAIIALGGALGLQCLAEGVEHPEELAVLRALGCDLAQGHLFARPMPAGALEQFLDQRPPGLLVAAAG
ncbi:MAG: putative bifunctional diguanylate cyclase/phosphodiesterase [Acidimicrobiales bacterium]